jgi:DUF2934 family protein
MHQSMPRHTEERNYPLLKSKPITTQVLECLARNPACDFETLVEDCSEFTWNQLFYEVDQMRQLGQLCLSSADDGSHFIGLPHNIGETMKTKKSDIRGQSTESVDRHIWIAQRAYQLYEAQGRQDGYALEHWLKAEQEIRSADTQKSS